MRLRLNFSCRTALALNCLYGEMSSLVEIMLEGVALNAHMDARGVLRRGAHECRLGHCAQASGVRPHAARKALPFSGMSQPIDSSVTVAHAILVTQGP